MTDTKVLTFRGPSTYLDSTDATTDHSQALTAPMLKDQTVLLTGLDLGNPPIGATFDGAFVVTAAADFDGTVTLEALPVLAPWVPALGYDDLPDLWDVSPATFTGSISAGDLVSFAWDSFGTTFAAGSLPAYGVLVRRTDTGTQGTLYTSRIGDERAPSFVGDFYSTPTTPTGLVPNNNKIVGAAKPVVKADQPSEPMIAQKWQVGLTSAGFSSTTGLATPSFDSGEVASTVLQLDLSATAFTGFPAGGTSRYLTCQYKSQDGQWSDFATPVQVGGWQALPAPVLTSPTFGVTLDPNPLYTWTPDGAQTKYQVVTTYANTTTVIDNSGEQAGTATSYQPAPKPPAGQGSEGGVLLLGSELASVELRQFDDVDRIATPGLPVYGSTTQTFQHSDNATVIPPDSVSIEQIGSSPWVRFTITISDAAKAATLYFIMTWGATTETAVHVNRTKIANMGDPTNVEGSWVYTWIYWNARPWQDQYVGGVKLVTAAGTSDAEYGSLDSLEVSGFNIGNANPASANYGLIGRHSGVGSSFSRTDQVSFLQGLGAQFPSYQWNTESFIAGDCQGVIRDFDDVSATDWQRTFRVLASSGEVLQIAYDDVSYPGLIFDYSVEELDGSGSPSIKQVKHKSVQLDVASYFDIPLGGGAPTIETFDFEALVSGDVPTDGEAVLREDTGGGLGSPGVIDKDGTPSHSAAAAQHGSFGVDCGWTA